MILAYLIIVKISKTKVRIFNNLGFYNMPDKTVLKDSKLRRINPKYHQRFEELFQMTNSDLKLKFRRFNYLIAVIDLLCILLDFYIIGGLYLQVSIYLF
jgi:hypothetical protein